MFRSTLFAPGWLSEFKTDPGQVCSLIILASLTNGSGSRPCWNDMEILQFSLTSRKTLLRRLGHISSQKQQGASCLSLYHKYNVHMKRTEFVFHAICVVRSPHTNPSKTPIQPVFAQQAKGTVILDPGYSDGLADLEDFSHIYLFYVFHKTKETKLTVRPFLEEKAHGVFATRASCRPNKLGFSVVKLISVEGNVLNVEDIDVLDGTPVIDIKPYIARFDTRDDVRSGWQDAIPDDTAALRGRRGFQENGGLKSIGISIIVRHVG
jgi:tRNA (adenine37-N6)-methyltransferase